MKNVSVKNCPVSSFKGSMFALAAIAGCLFSALSLTGQVVNPTSVYLQTPPLTTSATTNLTSPVHFQATAESTYAITGYAIYVDSNLVYKNTLTTLDTWVVISSGTHSIVVTAWDSTGGLLQSSSYSIDITGFTAPTPPPRALVLNVDALSSGSSPKYPWSVQPNAGGACSTQGTIGTWTSSSDPNTSNAPDPTGGEFFTETNTGCTSGSGLEDNTLFAWKDSGDMSNAQTNYLWDFWFYVPTTNNTNYIQALEADYFTALKMEDGDVHDFMFGSQCNYEGSSKADYLEFAYPLDNDWAPTSYSCQPTRPYSSTLQSYSEGAWHHVTGFYQRVTPNGSSPVYQNVAAGQTSSNDTNTDLLFGTMTIDGYTYYLGYVGQSVIPSPAWSPVIGVQHQLDIPPLTTVQTIDEYVDAETLYAW
jgi:hypothetical protein